MHFGMTDEQRMIVDTTRAFVEAELYPHEALVERTGHLPMEIIREVQAKAIEITLICNHCGTRKKLMWPRVLRCI